MNEQCLYLGNICLKLETDMSLPWTKTDYNFWKKPIESENEYTINLDCDSFEINSENKRQIADDMFLYENTEDETREYLALYLQRHPVYAYSKKKGHTIYVSYLPGTMAKESANFSLWILLQIENILLENDALILHSCFIENEGEAILFTAPSGTGKTTQGTFWRDTFGSTIVNGDKCMLQRIDGRWYACGFPLHGSAAECENKVVPLKCISIVRQSFHDKIENPSVLRKMQLLYSETTVNNWSDERITKAMDLIQNLVLNNTVVVQYCTLSDKGAKDLHCLLYNQEI